MHRSQIVRVVSCVKQFRCNYQADYIHRVFVYPRWAPHCTVAYHVVVVLRLVLLNSVCVYLGTYYKITNQGYLLQ